MAARAAGAPFAPLTHEPLHNTVVPAPIQPKPEPKTARKDQDSQGNDSGIFEGLAFSEADLGQLLGALEGFKDQDGKLSKQSVLESADRREAIAPKTDKVEAQPTDETAWRRQSREFLGNDSEVAGKIPLVRRDNVRVESDDPGLSKLLLQNLHQSSARTAQRRVRPSPQRLAVT